MRLLPALFGGGQKKEPEPESRALVAVQEERSVVPRRGDVVVRRESREIAPRRGGALVQCKPKAIKIHGEVYNLDEETLVRMVKRITQDIGSYKEFDGPYAAIVLGALRKARGDMVSLLEEHFRVHWRINDYGESEFTRG